jgi:hypothetical protein
MAITLHQALKSVSAHCDHARAWDHVGFSGRDAEFANKMAEAERITSKMEWYIARFVRKYRRQVVENYERAGEQITQGLKGKAKVAAADAWLAALVWEHQSEAEVAQASKPKNVISAAAGATTGDLKHFVIRFPYNPTLVETVKRLIDYRDRSFDKTDRSGSWIVQPVGAAVPGLRTLVAQHGFVATDGALTAFEKLVPQAVAA